MKTFIYGLVAYLHYYLNRFEIFFINLIEWVFLAAFAYVCTAAFILLIHVFFG